MGMNYYLKCLDCKQKQEICEFSIVNHIEMKHPDDAETVLEANVMPFLLEHKGHKITIVDSKGNETEPGKITGAYVLGIEEDGS